MSEAPKKIWAMAAHIGEYFCDPPVNDEDRRFLTEYTRSDLVAAKDAEIARLREALSDAADALDLANRLLSQEPVSYAIPLTNQFNARHAAAERARAALTIPTQPEGE